MHCETHKMHTSTLWTKRTYCFFAWLYTY